MVVATDLIHTDADDIKGTSCTNGLILLAESRWVRGAARCMKNVSVATKLCI